MSKQPAQTEQPDQQSKPVIKKERRRAIAAIVAVTVGLIIILGYILPGEWGGFTEYTTPKSDNVEYHPRRTLWDLLSLLVIPAVLLIAGTLFTRFERENDNRLAQERAEVNREIASTNLRDAALREYFDRMSDLLLGHKLASSSAEDPVRDVARTRTLTILRTLAGDGERKGSVVRFLYEADLVKGDNPIVNLNNADLSGAQLQGADLLGAQLQGADLSRAQLQGANLSGADLEGANISGADLERANLSKAQLQGADLSTAQLQGANLSGADLRRADLMAADLRKADLQGADLRRADLVAVDLQEVIVTQEQLSEVENLGRSLFGDEI